MISMDQNLDIPERILWRIDDGRAVLFDENEGNPFLLNRTATQIWKMVHEGKRVDAILEELRRRYPDVPSEQVRQETVEILEELCNRQILE